jgi:hypothetical protein
MNRGSVRMTLLWSVLGGLLLWALHTTFWYGSGRAEFLQHWGIPDRMLGFGESKLYLLMLVFGLPAGFCFAQAFAGVKLLETFEWPKALNARKGLLLPAAVAALGSILIAAFTIHFAWFTDDEQAYLLQSELYAKGTLTMPVIEPAALIRHGFTVEVLPKDGVPQWTGVYPPLQPFMMALSSFLGSPNLSQFLCVALIVYNTGRLATKLFDSERVGTVTAWLCAISPLLIGLGATYHTSILATTLTVFSARLFLWNLDHGSFVRGLPLGVVAGFIVLARPLEGTLVVGVIGLALLVRTVLALRRKSSFAVPLSLVGYAVGGLLPLAIMSWVNIRLTGHPLQGAYSILEKEIGRFMGFGTHMMWGRTHSPELGVVQTVTSLVRVNAFAFGWPLSLGLVALGLVAPLRDRRVLALLGISLLHLTAYFFLAFGSVHDFGHAYHVWHMPTIAMASAWVLCRAHALGEDDVAWASFARWTRVSVLAMTCVAVAVFWPAQLTRWRDVSEIIWRPVRAARAAAKGKPAVILWTTIQPPGTQRTWVFRPPAPHPDSNLLWAFDSPPWYPYLKKDLPGRKFFRLTWRGEEPVVTPAKL